MNNDSVTEAIRLLAVNGKVKIRDWTVLSPTSSGSSSHWGDMYAICHVMDGDGDAERLCGRVEGVAYEAYRRSPGGLTNKLRQALRNANRYLYLRNTMREDNRKVLAAMNCLAIRGTDAYACGVGPRVSLIVSAGRVRSFVDPVLERDVGMCEDWWIHGYLLGRHAVLSDQRFSYRQALPGDLVLMIAADDVGVLGRVGDEIATIAGEKEIRGAAHHLAGLAGKSTNLSALLLRLGSDAAELQQKARASVPYAASRPASPDQASVPSRQVVKARAARRHRGRLRQKSLIPSNAVSVAQDETTVGQWPGPGLSAELSRRRNEARQERGRQSHQLLHQTGELCRVIGAIVVSLVSGLARGGRALLRSGWRLIRHISNWITKHRVPQKVGKGCELAFLGVWAGSKGLVVRILPERQTSTRTYSASARPVSMARVKLVGFQPSRRSRAAIGALIILGVVVVIALSAPRITSRLDRADVEPLMARAEDNMLLAETEDSPQGRIALLLEAKDLIDQAAALKVEDTELTELSEQLERQLDAATGVLRISFEMDRMLTIPEGSLERVLIHEDQLYVLDTAGQRVHRYVLDEEGRPTANQEPWIWELQANADTVPDQRIVDIEWVDAANGRLSPALLLLTAGGSLLELNPTGVARDISVTDVLPWQNAQAIRTYYGSLYVLDLGRQNVIKYIPTANDYTHPPVNYFQGSLDIQWGSVVDMAIDGSVYLLLSNGSIMKFAAGEPEAFRQEKLYPPLERPVAIFASTDSGSVFVAEPDQERIVQFATDGQLIRQFRAFDDDLDPFKDLHSFAVDPRHDRLFLSTVTGIFSAPLPSLQ